MLQKLSFFLKDLRLIITFFHKKFCFFSGYLLVTCAEDAQEQKKTNLQAKILLNIIKFRYSLKNLEFLEEVMSSDKKNVEQIAKDLQAELIKNKSYEDMIPNVNNENRKMIIFCKRITNVTKKSEIVFDWEEAAVAPDPKIQEDTHSPNQKSIPTLLPNGKPLSMGGGTLHPKKSHFMKALKIFENFKAKKFGLDQTLAQVNQEFWPALTTAPERPPTYIYQGFSQDFFCVGEFESQESFSQEIFSVQQNW